MKRYIYSFLLLSASVLLLHAEDSIVVSQTDLQALLQRVERLEQAHNQQEVYLKNTTKEVAPAGDRTHRLTIGGYGEATMKRCFYSNNYLRYTSPREVQERPIRRV